MSELQAGQTVCVEGQPGQWKIVAVFSDAAICRRIDRAIEGTFPLWKINDDPNASARPHWL